VTEVDDGYVMGRTEAERARLSQQDRIFAPHSENLFRQAGIAEGMRVVDVGCGVGDTTALLARIVGPAGSVIGVDQDAASLEAAERMVAGAGLSNGPSSSEPCRTLTWTRPLTRSWAASSSSTSKTRHRLSRS
jgi:protein-L-isoaspartate O-methyltransferase